VKGLLLAFLMLSGCSSWKQKDFEKELEKSSAEEVKPVVAATAKEEKILEKFEVQSVDESPDKREGAKVAAKETAKAKPPLVEKKAPPIKEPIKQKVKGPSKSQEKMSAVQKLPPKDYPAELIQMNERARRVWDQYKPNHFIDQKVYLDIHYLGMTVGKIMVMNKGKKMINGKEVWHFHARFKSAPFYSNIYELDDTVDTYVTTDKFLSIRYSLIQRESKQNVDDLQLIDRDQFKTYWFYHQKKTNGPVKDKKKDEFIPYFSVDPFSVVFFYQGLPLKNGDIYEIPIVNKAKLLILKSEVEGRETIQTEGGQRKAIRVHATTKYTGETLKSGDLHFWFSDDDKRVLLKARAKIKIGSVTGDIVDK
jgi:hypothetical protein